MKNGAICSVCFYDAEDSAFLVAALTNAIQIERVIGQFHFVFLGNCFLPLFDHIVNELDHFAALQADQVVVVAAVIGEWPPFEIAER